MISLCTWDKARLWNGVGQLHEARGGGGMIPVGQLQEARGGMILAKVSYRLGCPTGMIPSPRGARRYDTLASW